MVTKTNHSIAVSLYKIFLRGGKQYIVPSALALQGLLAKYHKTEVERRRIFYALRYLQDQGYIRRKRRYAHAEDGQILQLPGMITWTLKGADYLYKNGIKGAIRIIKKITAWMKKDDKRFPEPLKIKKEMSEIDRDKNLTRLKELIDSFA